MCSRIPKRPCFTLNDGGGKGVLVVRFNGDGGYCMSGGLDRTVRLWNPHRGTLVQEYGEIHGYEIRDVQISHDNARFASCGGDRDVFIWDIVSGKCTKRLKGHSQRVNTLSFNSESSVLASGSNDTCVKLWDCRSSSRSPIQTLGGFKDSVSCITFVNEQLFISSVDGCVNTFDIRAKTICTDHIGHGISSICVSHDQNCLLVSCLDDSLRLFDCSNGKLLNYYTGHQNHSFYLSSCFSNDDAFVFSGSEDNSIHCWDLVDSAKHSTFESHKHIVTSVDYHPTNECLVSSSMDGTVCVWKHNR